MHVVLCTPVVGCNSVVSADSFVVRIMSTPEDMINEGAPDWPHRSANCEGCRFERELVDDYLVKHPEDATLDFETLLSKTTLDDLF